MKWTRAQALAAGAALIVVANAIALGGAAFNRSGTPESVLRLTERELVAYAGGDRDNSGLALRIAWRTPGSEPMAYPGSWGGGSVAWLDREKMAALGFDVSRNSRVPTAERAFAQQLSREVLLVLELDGEAARKAAEQARAAAQKLRDRGGAENAKLADDIERRESTTGSRLFVIDAGLERLALRARYADRGKYAIVRGRVAPAGEQSGLQRGYIAGLLVDEINVPAEYRPLLEGAESASPYGLPEGPRVKFEATVAFGQRLEPWLASLERR